ncbi:Guanine nucleotide exchange factor for Cdc42p [Linderina pennispora]|nr:Guanine nucleotide exchange factor for Cdc42p [Linderina pennispora]
MDLTRRNPSFNAGVPVGETSTPTQNMDSILNRTAPATSIFQNSLNLLDKLACIPGFEPYLSSLLDDSSRDAPGGSQYLDPIQLLWDTFRQGTSLCVLYNALGPAEPLRTTLDDVPNTLNQRKDRVYRFVKACKENQIVRDEDLFTISDLFKDDTNSFVKVLKTVGIVLDVIESRGLLDMSKLEKKPSARFTETQLGPPQDNRERVIKEFVETERRYVQDLETLQGYMQELQKQNIISNETTRYMFANLNSMVDFQRRFLIGVEANASHPPEDQHFGSLFINMEEGFAVYEPYCANFTRATKLCASEEQALQKLAHVIEPHYELPSMLIKPVQRICKYPMMMDELAKFYDKESATHQELKQGVAAINRVVEQVNEAERKEGNLAVVSELEERVEDWKGYSISTFGELFLHDTFVMSTTGVERELYIYLFENILICCKVVSERDRRRTNRARSNGLQLKGRIFLYSIHSIVDTTRDSQLSLTIYWRDVVMENFSLACRSEDQLKLWKSTMDRLIARTNEKTMQAKAAAEQAQLGISGSQMSRGLGSMQSGDYDSEDDVSASRRGRYSEGSSLTAAMRHEKQQQQGGLTYRKTYDGGASRSRNGRKGSDYQQELVEGVERSMTVSHGRRPTNGSQSSAGDYTDASTMSRGSPMGSSMYYGSHMMPPLPVPSMPRNETDPILKQQQQQNVMTSMVSSPIPTAFSSAMSPITPNGTNGVTTPAPRMGTPPVMTSGSTRSTPVPSNQARPTKVKVHFQEDIFVIVVKPDIQFKDLVERVERKIKICAGPRVGITGGLEHDLATSPPLGIRLRYQDEDGDMIIIGSNDDVQMAFESANASRSDATVMGTLNIFASV